MMAKNDQRSFFRFERIEGLVNGAHRNQLTAFNASLPMFKRFADIDQAQFLAGIEPLFYGQRSNFEGFGHT